MIKIIPEHERILYSREEIHEKFKGKWLYLVNAEYTKSSTLIRAKVAVIADKTYEEWEKGIYRQFKTKANSPTSEYGCLLVRAPGIKNYEDG